MKIILLITGDPGVGKTTVLTRAINLLKTEGYTVGGMISREARSKGTRIRFDIIDIGSGRTGVLASTNLKVGPRLGRYRVNLVDLAQIGARSLLDAVDRSDIIVCDEIGPMELYSPDFRRAVEKILRSQKPVLAVIHKRMKDPLIEEIKSDESVEMVEVTYENREGLPSEIASKLLESLKG